MNESRAIVGVEPKDFFIELERRDQQQIVMRALGDVVDELFYEVHGKKSLSFEGINTAAFFMGDIEVDEWVEWEKIEMFGDRIYWSATVRARNTKYNIASLGTAEDPELMDVYDRDEKNQKIPDPDRPGEFKTHLEPDEFCRRKALSKAQRNAKRAVMPTAVLSKWLQYFIDLQLFKRAPTLRGKPVIPFKPKTVDAEYQILVDVKPEKKRAVKPEPEEKPPEKAQEAEPLAAEGPPGSVEDIRERLSKHIVGLEELLVISDRGEYFRVGRKKRLYEEIEYTIDELVKQMGGSWSAEENEWRIPKEAPG